MSRKIQSALIRLSVLLFALFLGLAGTCLQAQEPPPASEELSTAASEQQQDTLKTKPAGILIPAEMVKRAPADQRATLSFMNRKITRFRAEVTGSPPKVRVTDSIRRIDTLLHDGVTGPVDTLAIPRAVLIRIDRQTVFALVDDDLDLVAGETLESRAQAAVANLEQAIAEAEETLMPQHLLRRTAYALLATLLFGLLLWLLHSFRKNVQKRILKSTDKGLQQTIAGRIVTERDHRAKIISFASRLILFLSYTTVLVFTYIWLTYILKLFPFTRPWGEALGGFLLGTAVWVRGGLAAGVGTGLSLPPGQQHRRVQGSQRLHRPGDLTRLHRHRQPVDEWPDADVLPGPAGG